VFLALLYSGGNDGGLIIFMNIGEYIQGYCSIGSFFWLRVGWESAATSDIWYSAQEIAF
jgi:hypothetical protein